MLTPQEVSEHVFAKASFGGYNMAMVDEFLDVLTGDYTALYNENAVLKSKMKVLVDKVEEYRSTEEAMRKALMTAQRMADELVHEAEQKRDEMLRQAEQDAAGAARRLRKELAEEEYRLTAAKNSTAACVLKTKKLYEEQMAFLDSLDSIFPPAPPEEDHAVDQAVQDIEDNVQRLLAETDEPAQTAAQPEEDESAEPTLEFAKEPAPVGADANADEDEDADDMDKTIVRRLDFGELQFGKDYEIK